ncbi:MAG: hypothetical protein FWE31_01710 [Firmicutes bacterium]|nr:hypothetical protein [Bacillota bacterium]
MTLSQARVVARVLLQNKQRIEHQIRMEEKRFGNTIIACHNSLMSADAIIDRVINLMERKDKLIVLNNRIEQLVANMPSKAAELIRFFCFGDESIIPKVSMRTAKQQLQRAIDLFAERMENIGINKITFTEILKMYPNAFEMPSGPTQQTEEGKLN